MFEVKFGTPKPVTFREYCEYGKNVMDIDLEARFAGKCEISDYDHSRYANDEEVSLFIKSNCSEILEKCFKNWPEGKSIVRFHFKGLDEFFSTELKNCGIKAKTDIFSKVLTEDSEKMHKELMNELIKQPTDFGWDHVCFDTVPSKPEGTYMVSPASMGYKYKDDRVYYRPGERVEVDYWAVGSDTSYHVTVNAPDLEVKYGSVIHISFTMPEHDVNILMEAQSVMTPHNTGFTGLNGFMGMFMDMANTTETQKPVSADNPVVSDGSEWTCPLCGSKNKGNFCCECGGARPAKDV